VKEFIIAGRVRVNGQVASLGQKADLAPIKSLWMARLCPKQDRWRIPILRFQTAKCAFGSGSHDDPLKLCVI
jgi:hypothetical protein